MTDKQRTEKPTAELAGPGTAPELPLAVAKSYGIHHHTHKAEVAAEAAKAGGAAEPDAAAAEAVPAGSSTPTALGEDTKTDEAVDDILGEESDELLEAEDNGRALTTPEKRGFWRRVGGFFAAWWRNKWARWITIIVLVLGIAAAAGIPQSRYFLLNTAGVRSSVTVTVQDDSTQLPLKNVKVTVGSQQALTDVQGRAQVQHVRLGAQTLTISRLAFATVKQHIVVGWGSNPLGTFNLQVTGVQYLAQVTDWLSGKPLASAEADTDGGLNAVADKTGKITLTTDDQNAANVTVTISAKGYRTTTATLKPDGAVAKVSLVPSQKAVYVSKQSGKLDLYSSDIDGQNKKVILPGSGTENGNNISLAVAPAGDWAALVSTRDNLTDNDGYRLSALTLVDLNQGTVLTPEHAEQIKLIDWTGSQIIYETTVAGASAANGQRSRLIAYDYTKNSRVQLAAANQFNAVVTAGGMVYYAVSSTDPAAHAALYRVKPDGSNRQTVFGQEVWTLLRSDFTILSLQTAVGWYTYSTTSGVVTKGDAPGSTTSRLYVMNQDGNAGLWVDQRDGKGVLLDHVSDKDTTVLTADGLAYPVRWLGSNAAIYRVSNNQETADYAVSLNGGSPHKVADVTNTFGFAQGL